MSPHRSPFVLGAVAVGFAAMLAACGGGGGSSPGGGGVVTPPAPTPTPTPSTSTQQVVTMALPSTAMGSRNDPSFGFIGGFTQQLYSQVLGFAPGTQIMIQNGQNGLPHTLGVVSTTAFDSGSSLSLQPTGGSTIQAGFNTGSINGGALVGPFTLAAGTFYIGCAYHYQSDSMRTVLQVAAGAQPGPQATPPAPTQTAPPDGKGY
ncbi:MAG TPA: hypothetical protein VFF00_05500 [Candidatus Elarobacter sp.]|nr:hypothetical protein [Candidatus Elarobacter sp.]